MITRLVLTLVLAMVGAAFAEPGDPPPRQNPAAGSIMVGNVEYKKLATREETEARIMNLLFPNALKWGSFSRLTPFDYDKRKGIVLATAQGPEEDLPKLVAGGPGLDLSRKYKGKSGKELSWEPIGDISNRRVDFKVSEDDRLDDNAAGYLYGTIEAEKDSTVDVTMGSDDGLRLWLNGRLIVDKDVPRSLDPEEDRVRMDLKQGVNHVLIKVSQIGGGFEYQVMTRGAMDPLVDAQLQYFLNTDFPRTPEDLYYRVLTIPTADVVLEVGGLGVMPARSDGTPGMPVVSTRRGDVFLVEGAYEDPPFGAKFRKYASGLHEPLGVDVKKHASDADASRPSVYCVQRGELTRLGDTDADGVADVYEAVSDGWGVSGNYHEFAFGPKFDSEGNAWVTLNVGFCASLGKSIVPYRGWALKVAPDGKVTPFCDGLRSPNGIGQWTDGTMFYLDNQGDFVGTNRLAPLLPGGFSGHPAGLRWREGWSDSSERPAITPAAIWFPYKKMGQSAADFLLYSKYVAGKFGPFEGQVFVGDQMNCSVMRVTLEKIDGVYQGACYPFREGLQCGVNRLAWGTDGSMFVGQTDRGWGSIGRARYGLERLVWTGKVPFEVKEMRIVPGGFELEFTKPVDAASAANIESYSMESYTYEYHPQYGSDEMETEQVKVTKAEVVNPTTVRLSVDKLRSGGMGYVHELHMPGVKSVAGDSAPSERLLHDVAYYTVQRTK